MGTHTNKISILIFIYMSNQNWKKKKKKRGHIREKVVTLMKTHDGMNPSASTQVTSPWMSWYMKYNLDLSDCNRIDS